MLMLMLLLKKNIFKSDKKGKSAIKEKDSKKLLPNINK